VYSWQTLTDIAHLSNLLKETIDMTQNAAERKTQEISFTKAFSSFSVNDLKKAKNFYSQILGIDVKERPEGLELPFDGEQSVFIYPKKDHQPATFTVLNFPVDDIEMAVDKLAERGVRFESFDGSIETDDKGIFRGKERGHGPNIAWFKDPAGNFLSIIESD
jgi:predicted enzyme related to lactoylglutathione lyase